MYDSTYDSSIYQSSSTADPATTVAVLIGVAIVAIIAYVITAIFLGKIFKKAGVEAWKAWVPIYNQWVFNELGDQKGWISLLYLAGAIPVIGFIGTIVAVVFSCIAAYKIGIGFGKEGVFVLLYIFLPIVWVIWLAVDQSVWKPTHEVMSQSGNDQTPPQSPTPPSQPAAM